MVKRKYMMTSERPQTHSIKDIYNVGTRFLLRRSADELAWIPGISHTRKLVNNGVNTVGELFDGDLNQTKNLKDLKRGLESHTDLIYDIFHSDGFDMETGLKTVTLPINYDAGRPFIDNARAFIKDLHDTVVSEGDNSSISKTSFAYTIKEIYVYNPNHPECASYADIARKFNCTSFNINYKLLTMRKHLRSLFKGETVEIEDVCFRADPRMISDLERFADMVGNTISVESFKRKSGASDGRTLSFLTDILGMNTTAGVSGKKIPCVSKHPQKLIDTSIGTLLEFFRSNVIHIRYDHEFRIFLEKTFKDTPELIDAFNSLVKHSDEFVWSNEDGEEVVALRWDLLEFLTARICRILFDNNCIDYRSAISDSELTKLYNIRARQFGVSLISERNLSASLCSKACWRIMTVGKTGFWRLRQYKDETFNLDIYTSEFINTVSSTDLEAFLRKAEEDGISRMYERSGLRTAFSRNGGKANTRRQARTNIRRWTAKDISDILDFAEEILSENGWSMANSDLVKELQKLYPELNYATCSQYLTKSNRFDILQRSGNLSSIITVKGHRHIVPESFRDTIRKCAVQDIALSKDNAIGRSDLYDKYIGHVPADQNANAALSKIFGDADTFVKTRDANGNVLLSLTPRALYHAKHSMNEACRN